MIDKEMKICPNYDIIQEELIMDGAAEEFTDSIFLQLWDKAKTELKEMSRKELAEQMYCLGVRHFMQKMNEHMKDINKLLEKP